MTRIPELVLGPDLSLVLLAALAAWTAAAAVLALVTWRRYPQHRSALMLTAGFCLPLFLIEAPLDSLIHFNLAVGKPTVFTASGITVSLWGVLVYSSYIPTAIYVLLRNLDTDDPAQRARRAWRAFAALVAFVMVTETLAVQSGIWMFYGTEPWQVLGVPFNEWTFQPAVLMAAAAVVEQFTAHARGRTLLWCPALAPGIWLAIACVLAWPVILGHGLQLPLTAMNLLGAASVLLNLAAVDAAIHLGGKFRRPHR
ncbi:hypothetical protein AB0A77_36340 [Streptomyces varsoviensis]|uniref:hypothetical protein n=1 Tax=Streptomyces varsoviensis TaxID=67373 RepID=UPI003406C812